ncbi:MAG: DoxX family protein [Chitinophagales bacterium]
MLPVWAKHIIRISIGLVFIASALLKFLSIDTFEIYVFQQQILPFPLAAIFSRLLIATEVCIGLLLIIQFAYSRLWKITVGLLILFSLFLLWKIFQGNASENCHCFGELLPVNSTVSLIKNAVLLLLLWSIRKPPPFHLKQEKNIALFLSVFTFTLIFILSPPDFMLDWSKIPVNDPKKVSERIAEDSTLVQYKATDGKKLICLYSVTCMYCQHAAGKISGIVQRHDLQDDVLYVFTGDENDLDTFLEKSGSELFTYTFIPHSHFFSIAGPSVPAIYLVDNGIVQKQYNYRNINEAEIVRFLRGNG